MSSKWIILVNVGIIILAILVSRASAASLVLKPPVNLRTLNGSDCFSIVATDIYGDTGSKNWTITANNVSKRLVLEGVEPTKWYLVKIYIGKKIVFSRPYESYPEVDFPTQIQNLTVECINSTTTEVIWKKPLSGKASGYSVSLITNETEGTNASKMETTEQRIMLYNLVPKRSYTVKVVSTYARYHSAPSEAGFIQGTNDYGNCTEEPDTNAADGDAENGTQTNFPTTVIVAIVLGAVLGSMVFLGLAYFLVRVGGRAVDRFVRSRQRVRVGQYFEMATFNNRPDAAIPE